MALSPRQEQVLSAAARGRSVAQTAAELGVGQSTVKQHLAEARLTLAAETTTQAVAIAVALGLIEIQTGQTSRMHKIRAHLRTVDAMIAEMV